MNKLAFSRTVPSCVEMNTYKFLILVFKEFGNVFFVVVCATETGKKRKNQHTKIR